MRTALLAAALLLAPGALARAADAPPASPLLPQGHWAVAAAERLYELGLAPDWLPAQRSVPVLVVERTLREGVARADASGSSAAPLATLWATRFADEFPGAAVAAAGAAGPRLLGGRASLGFQAGSVREAAPGASPPAPAALRLVAPGTDPVAAAGAAATLGPHLAAGVGARATPASVHVGSLEAVGALGPFAISVGRAPLGYGPGQVGAVVARGAAALDRVEAMTTAPVHLPGPLRVLGAFALDLAVTRFDEARHPYHPWLWGMQLSWRPHPRLTLAAIRGVMFGGALWEGIPTARVPLSLLGIRNYRENNVYSGAIELRLPSERLLPLTAKLEWGTDDNPGAAFSWPGLVAGLTAPLLPGLPASLGVEYAYFGRGPFGYHDPFAWYAHGQYTGGWATDETPLGDPLGGNGRALRLVASADPLGGLVRVAGTAWVQDRFVDNLYAPRAGGRSVGVEGAAELRSRRLAATVSGSYERGRDGWSRRALEVAATLFF